MKKCPRCATENPDDAKDCPCGYQYPDGDMSQETRSGARLMAQVVLLALFACMVVFVTRTVRETYREFIVPQGYVGPLKIVIAPLSETPVKSTEIFRNSYIYTFPADGVLKVPDGFALTYKAREEWKYPDGTLLRTNRGQPDPGRVEIVAEGHPAATGSEYKWTVLPAGQTAKQ